MRIQSNGLLCNNTLYKNEQSALCKRSSSRSLRHIKITAKSQSFERLAGLDENGADGRDFAGDFRQARQLEARLRLLRQHRIPAAARDDGRRGHPQQHAVVLGREHVARLVQEGRAARRRVLRKQASAQLQAQAQSAMATKATKAQNDETNSPSCGAFRPALRGPAAAAAAAW